MSSPITLTFFTLIVVYTFSNSISSATGASSGPFLKQQQETSFSSFVCFGDSLSDVKNIKTLSNGKYPAPNALYFDGRFCNEYIWTERLATALGLGDQNHNNFAYAGASTDQTYALSVYQEFPVPGILQQVQNYIEMMGGQMIDPEALYSVEFNGNDYSTTSNPISTVAKYFDSISMLYDAGARNILINTMGAIPPAYLPFSSVFQPLIDAHNAEVRSQYAAFTNSHPDAHVWLLDLEMRFEEIQSNPMAFGLSNLNESCIDKTLVEMCSVPSEYMFYDEIHWGSTIHQIVSDDVLLLLTGTTGGEGEGEEEEPTLSIHYWFGGMIPTDAICYCK